MAFLAAINARKRTDTSEADTAAAERRPSLSSSSSLEASHALSSSSQRQSRPSVDSFSLRPSDSSTGRPSLVSRPSLAKRGSLSFSIDDTGLPLTLGREGPLLRNMSQKIRDHKDLTDEKIELIYEAFRMFPLDDKGCLTSESLGDYYSKTGLVFTPDECDKMMALFVGKTCTSVDFEEFALAYIRCERTLPVSTASSYYFIVLKGVINAYE